MLKNKEIALTGIAHLCILFQFVGLVIAFVIYYMEKDSSDFIRKGVKQAIGLQVLISIFILAYKTVLLFYGSVIVRAYILRGAILLLYLAVIGLALYAAFNFFKGRYYQYPLVGRLIQNIDVD